jgi:hypothetical protein
LTPIAPIVADTVYVTPHAAVRCQTCVRLVEECALLLLEYDAARARLLLTPRADRSYCAWWAELVELAELIAEAQRSEQLHQGSHRGS